MIRSMRIGILTRGGGCPGLTAVIRAIIGTAIDECGREVVRFLDGFEGRVDLDALIAIGDVVLFPGIPHEIDVIGERIRMRNRPGKAFGGGVIGEWTRPEEVGEFVGPTGVDGLALPIGTSPGAFDPRKYPRPAREEPVRMIRHGNGHLLGRVGQA